jgi:hypothetical protein
MLKSINLLDDEGGIETDGFENRYTKEQYVLDLGSGIMSVEDIEIHERDVISDKNGEVWEVTFTRGCFYAVEHAHNELDNQRHKLLWTLGNVAIIGHVHS